MPELDEFDDLGLKLRSDTVLFARIILGFNPFPYQEKFLKDESKRVVACFGRQTGKTTVVAVRAVHFAFTNAEAVVLVVSPSLRQSMIMFERICRFIESNPYTAKSVRRKTCTVVELRNGSRIIALPCAAHRLRGFTAHMVIVDEAAFVPDEVVTEILNPMLAATDGVLILAGTPWGRNYFYKAFTDPDFSVHKVKSSECPLISEEFLRKQRECMTAEAYAREYEAEFVEETQSYFSQNLVQHCLAPELQLHDERDVLTSQTILKGEYYMGVDLGKLQDYSAAAIIEKKRNGTLELKLLKEFPLNTPYLTVSGWILRAYKTFRFKQVLIDQSGVGEPFLEILKDQGMNTVSGVKLTLQAKTAMLSNLRMLMERSKLKMPYLPRLFQQLNEQRYEYTGTGQLRFWHPPHAHDDQLWALALAVYAAKKTVPEGTVLRAF